MLLMGDFEGDTEEAIRALIADSYEVPREEVDRYDIIAAAGDAGCYDDAHWFLLRHRESGALMENEASHCSCYGFEGAWDPSETTVEALRMRKTISYSIPAHRLDAVRALIEGLAP